MGKCCPVDFTILGDRARSGPETNAMSILTRRAGTRCLRLLLSMTFTMLATQSGRAQEAPNSDDRNKLEQFRAGSIKPEDAQAACDKTARWYAARLADQKTRESGDNPGESALIKELGTRLGLPLPNSDQGSTDYARHPDRKPFIEEFGKALVKALEGPATQNANYIVRINAMRMVAEVGRAGYDGAAELCVKVLAKPDENDAVKFYALQGLKNLFYIVPEKEFPQKTIFQKDNTGVCRRWSKRASRH